MGVFFRRGITIRAEQCSGKTQQFDFDISRILADTPDFPFPPRSAFLISRQKLSYFSNSARMMLHPAAGLFSPGAARGIQNGVPSRPFAQAAGLSAPHLSSSDILSRGQSTQARARPANKSDLLALKGVGPVNAGLLLAQQITSVETLQEIYCNELKRDKQELLRFLSVSLLRFR